MQRHNHSLSWLGTDTSIKSDRVKLVLWTQIFPLRTKNTRETIQHYITFRHKFKYRTACSKKMYGCK